MGTYDSAFKKVFSDKRIFSEFIEAFVPALRDLNINEKNLVLENTSFTDPSLSNRESDLLYKIKYKNNDIFLYVLVEHQSTIDQLMPFRLLVYMTRIWERYIKDEKKDKKHGDKKFRLPLIIPIVFYDGEDSWSVPLNFKDKIISFDNIPGISETNIKNIYRYIPKFEYELIELAKIKSDDLLRLQNALGLLLTFDSSTSEDLTYVLRKIRQAFELLPKREKELLELYMKTLLIVFNKRNDIKIDMNEIIEKNGGENMFTIFEAKLKRIKEEGIKEGIKKDKIETVKKMLKMRINKEIISKVTELSMEEIEKIEKEN